MRRPEEALSELDKADNPPSGDAEFWTERARRYAEQRRFQQAIADCSRAIALEPMAAGHHLQRAGHYAALEQWGKATADCMKAMALGAAEDGSDAWFVCALTQLAVGDTLGYRHTCADMLARFGADAAQMWSVAHTCVLGPNAVADPARLVPLAKQALDAQPGTYIRQVTLGAALFRAGRLPEAQQRLNEAAALQPGNTPHAYLLAMCCARLGRPAEARQWLEQGTRSLEAALQWAPAENPLPWVQRVIFQQLRREAEALLAAGGAP